MFLMNWTQNFLDARFFQTFKVKIQNPRLKRLKTLNGAKNSQE